MDSENQAPGSASWENGKEVVVGAFEGLMVAGKLEFLHQAAFAYAANRLLTRLPGVTSKDGVGFIIATSAREAQPRVEALLQGHGLTFESLDAWNVREHLHQRLVIAGVTCPVTYAHVLSPLLAGPKGWFSSAVVESGEAAHLLLHRWRVWVVPHPLDG